MSGIDALRALVGRKGQLIAAVGPHIERCCFEVGQEVADEIAACTPLGHDVIEPRELRPHADLRRVLEARDAGQGLTSVNMGPPETHWQGVPLARAMETLELPIEGGPTATGMGNPHCTFFVADAEAVDLESRGPEIENHPLFPERTNVQFVSVTGENILRMRVWERGTGVTLASGSSSCATAVAAHRRGLTGPEVTIHLDGGEIRIRVTDEGVWMTGPTAHVFTGTLTDAFLESLT